jgi:hypothetical protein
MLWKETEMRIVTVLTASALVLVGAGASAHPLAGRMTMAVPDSPATAVHHKPGHGGGPPWARGRDQYRNSYRESYEERPVYRRQVCRTTYREVYDRYVGDYVSRPVRVCRSQY